MYLKKRVWWKWQQKASHWEHLNEYEKFDANNSQIVSWMLRLLGPTCYITKTSLYNFDPLKPHFYIVNLGITGVYIIFLISAQNIDCGYSLEPPRWGVLTSAHNLCFERKYKKYQIFYLKNFHFWRWNCLLYLNRLVFVMNISIAVSKTHTYTRHELSFISWHKFYQLFYIYCSKDSNKRAKKALYRSPDYQTS